MEDFILFIRFCYRVLYFFVTFGGYSGDLSPKSTLELLNGKSNVVLIDVRPEARDCKSFLAFSIRKRFLLYLVPSHWLVHLFRLCILHFKQLLSLRLCLHFLCEEFEGKRWYSRFSKRSSVSICKCRST